VDSQPSFTMHFHRLTVDIEKQTFVKSNILHGIATSYMSERKETSLSIKKMSEWRPEVIFPLTYHDNRQCQPETTSKVHSGMTATPSAYSVEGTLVMIRLSKVAMPRSVFHGRSCQQCESTTRPACMASRRTCYGRVRQNAKRFPLGLN
jgi:hypothetical protein